MLDAFFWTLIRSDHDAKKTKQKPIQLAHFHFLRNFITKLVCRAKAGGGGVSQLLWHVTLNWPFTTEPCVSGLTANERRVVDELKHSYFGR